jgi:phage baseplate assembly protein W
MVTTPLSKKRILYTDFDRDLTMHPVNSDIIRKTNEEAIKDSIRNLILTNRGERLFQPLIGCDITRNLFENPNATTVENIRNATIETIKTFEPRCNLIGVDVFANYDSNQIRVVIVFNVINSSEDNTTLEIILDKVR